MLNIYNKQKANHKKSPRFQRTMGIEPIRRATAIESSQPWREAAANRHGRSDGS